MAHFYFYFCWISNRYSLNSFCIGHADCLVFIPIFWPKINPNWDHNWFNDYLLSCSFPQYCTTWCSWWVQNRLTSLFLCLFRFCSKMWRISFYPMSQKLVSEQLSRFSKLLSHPTCKRAKNGPFWHHCPCPTMF